MVRKEIHCKTSDTKQTRIKNTSEVSVKQLLSNTIINTKMTISFPSAHHKMALA